MAEPTIAGIPTKDFDEWQAERAANGQAHVNDGGTMAGAEFATPADVAAKADASALTALEAQVDVAPVTVHHGSNAATERPDTDRTVVWVGTVAPENATTGDVTILDTSHLVLFDSTARTSGDLEITATGSWGDVDNDLDLTVNAMAGDLVALHINAKWKGGEPGTGRLNVRSVNRGAQIFPGNGVAGWVGPANSEQPIGAAAFYTVLTGDVVDGTVTFRLRGRVDGSTPRTLKAVSSDPFVWAARVDR